MTEKIFHKILENRIKEHKSKLLFQKKDGWSWKQITWLDYDSEVRGIASYLYDLGLSKGDEVLIISPNGLDCTFVESAVLMLGGVCVPVSESESYENIEYIINDSDKIKFVFAVNENMVNGLFRIIGYRENIEKIFTFSDSKFSPDGKVVSYGNVVKFGFLKRKKLNDNINERMDSILPGDSAIKLYNFRGEPTSKIVTHEMLIRLMELVNKKLRFISREDQSFSLLQNSDPFSKLINFLPLYIGNRGAMAMNEQEFYQDVKEIMPTILFLNSATLNKIQKDISANNTTQESLKNSFGGRVRYIFTDSLPGLSVKSDFIDSGISIIELNELATLDY